MFGISRILLLMIILVATIVFMYKLYYTRKINQRIQSGEITGRRLVDLSKMVMVAVIAGLVIYAGILMYVIHDYASMEYQESRNNYAIIDVSGEEYNYISNGGNVSLEDASFAKGYNKEANPGYDKEVLQSGDYQFVLFTRSAVADDFHPDFLCFVDYIGADKEDAICYNTAGFVSLEPEGGYLLGGSGGEIRDSVLYIGNLDSGCKFSITMNILDSAGEIEYDEAIQQAYKEEKGEFPEPEEFAKTVGKIDIVIE